MAADFFVSPDFVYTLIAPLKQATHSHNKAGSELLLARAKQAAPKLLMVWAPAGERVPNGARPETL